MTARTAFIVVGLFTLFACAFVAGSCSATPDVPRVFTYFFDTLAAVTSVGILELAKADARW